MIMEFEKQCGFSGKFLYIWLFLAIIIVNYLEKRRGLG